MNNRRWPKRICAIGGILLILAFVLNVVILNFNGGHRSKTLEIVNNLRQFSGAMQQWALDHGQTGAVIVTEENLAPYLLHPPKQIGRAHV